MKWVLFMIIQFSNSSVILGILCIYPVFMYMSVIICRREKLTSIVLLNQPSLYVYVCVLHVFQASEMARKGYCYSSCFGWFFKTGFLGLALVVLDLLCRPRWLLTQRPVSLCLPSAWIKLGATTAWHIFCLALDPLELESQMLGATLWLKGIKPRSSGRPFTWEYL